MPQEALMGEKPNPATQKQLELLARLDEQFFKSDEERLKYYTKKYGALSRKDLTKKQADAEIKERPALNQKGTGDEGAVKEAVLVDEQKQPKGAYLPALTIPHLMQTISTKIALDVISEQSKDGLGEGILYHKIPGIGDAPTVDLIGMLVSQSGLNTKTTIIESGLRELKIGDETRPAWHAKVRVEDVISGRSEEAEVYEPARMTEAWVKGEPFEARNGKKISVDRLVEDRMAVSKARRNAEARLLGIPTTILPGMVQKMMGQYKSQTKQ